MTKKVLLLLAVMKMEMMDVQMVCPVECFYCLQDDCLCRFEKDGHLMMVHVCYNLRCCELYRYGHQGLCLCRGLCGQELYRDDLGLCRGLCDQALYRDALELCSEALDGKNCAQQNCYGVEPNGDDYRIQGRSDQGDKGRNDVDRNDEEGDDDDEGRNDNSMDHNDGCDTKGRNTKDLPNNYNTKGQNTKDLSNNSMDYPKIC